MCFLLLKISWLQNLANGVLTRKGTKKKPLLIIRNRLVWGAMMIKEDLENLILTDYKQ